MISGSGKSVCAEFSVVECERVFTMLLDSRAGIRHGSGREKEDEPARGVYGHLLRGPLTAAFFVVRVFAVYHM